MSTGHSHLTTLDDALIAETCLPRDNGELVFEEPWQGRALAMGVVAIDRTGGSWVDFRGHLARAIAARGSSDRESEATAYYAAWLDALEALLSERGLLDPIEAGRPRSPGSSRAT
ncbi:MAG TPA: nitrile hydratase accessory protein [Acidimicrobiales bacterium]|nr:nitrile hydratase accessory protein [Acidimicrobiales bacterium]